jgi:heat shock protein HtpX
VAATFYTLKSRNERNSWLLMVTVAAVLGVLGFAIGYLLTSELAGGLAVTAIAVAVAALLSLGSYYRGASVVLAASRAREVSADEQPELTNVVREMAIAGNLPMPRVYIIEDSAPNAFATGRDPQHASIAVTTGLLDKLNREELQGVIGHELGHVGNYDIRFALLVGVLVGSIALLADIFLRWTWWSGLTGRGRSRDDRGGGGAAQLIIFLVAIVFAILAPFFARLVQLAVSRQREYLADATAVEFTRNPAGLEHALAKIAGDQEVLEVANRATQHLYIVNPIKKFEERSKGLFSTHPPIVDRINRLRSLRSAPPLAATDAASLAALD